MCTAAEFEVGVEPGVGGDFAMGGEGLPDICGEDGAGFGVEEVAGFTEEGAVEMYGIGWGGGHGGSNQTNGGGVTGLIAQCHKLYGVNRLLD